MAVSRVAGTGRTAAVLALFVAWAGCGGTDRLPELGADAPDAADPGDVATVPDDAAPADEGPTPTAVCEGIRLLGVLPWPGGGAQLLVRGAGDAATLEGPAGAPWTTALAPVAAAPGVTLIVLVPGPDATTHAARVRAARTLVERLPDGERIALRQAGDAATLLADLTADRAHLAARLDATTPATVPAPTAAEAREWLRSMAGVTGPFGPVSRAVVGVGGAAVAVADEGLTPVRLEWLTDDGGAVQDGVGGWGERLPEQAANDLVDWDAKRRQDVMRVGACPPPKSATATTLTLRTGAGTCEFEPPEPWKHLADAACDAAAAAADDFPYPRRISLKMTPAQRAIYDRFYADQSKEDFQARVLLGDGYPIDVVAHFRGQTSMDCVRRNYEVDLDGPEPRRLAPGVAAERFQLVSLCKDDHYYREVFAGRLLRERGAFPLDSRYVVLEIDGVNQGVYLLMEHPESALVRDHLDLKTILRRRLDPDNLPEDVKLPEDPEGAAAALATYRAVAGLIDTAPEGGLEAALQAVLDLDGYLEWMALNSFLKCGDYVDEAYFFASAEAAGAWWFRVMAWDPKDIYTACHHFGQWALPDEYGLVYCAEANLDKALLDPAVYARFVGRLEGVIAAYPAARLVEAMDAVQSELWEVLADDETAAAMVELVGKDPTAATFTGARTAIRADMDRLLAAAEARRTELQGGIARWQGAR